MTPDGRSAPASNWCSYDLSVIDTQTNTEIARVPIGSYSRGLAVDSACYSGEIAIFADT